MALSVGVFFPALRMVYEEYGDDMGEDEGDGDGDFLNRSNKLRSMPVFLGVQRGLAGVIAGAECSLRGFARGDFGGAIGWDAERGRAVCDFSSEALEASETLMFLSFCARMYFSLRR